MAALLGGMLLATLAVRVVAVVVGVLFVTVAVLLLVDARVVVALVVVLLVVLVVVLLVTPEVVERLRAATPAANDAHSVNNYAEVVVKVKTTEPRLM